jgi:hypothetical protein
MEILKIPARAFPHDFRHLAGKQLLVGAIWPELSFVGTRNYIPYADFQPALLRVHPGHYFRVPRHPVAERHAASSARQVKSILTVDADT